MWTSHQAAFQANNVVGAPVLHLYFSLEFCVFCVCPWTNYFSALSVFELHIDWVRVCVCVFFLSTLRLWYPPTADGRTVPGCAPSRRPHWADLPRSRPANRAWSPEWRSLQGNSLLPFVCFQKWRQLNFFPDYTKKYKDSLKINRKKVQRRKVSSTAHR